MMPRKNLFLATAIAILAAPAFAADLPIRTPPAPMLSPVPVYNWTGFYVGVNGGYGWGSQNPLGLIAPQFSQANSFNVNGGMFGGTIGGQVQVGHVVLGAEADADWAGISGTSTTTITSLPITLRLSSQTTGFMTARSRIGYAADNWLFYGTGGAALLNASAKGASIAGVPCGSLGIAPNCQNSQLRPGVALGLGVEYGFTPNLSAKLEYIWAGAISGASTQSVNTMRVGLNYRFGG
jgi:outer membrane immunogenic protein